MRRNFHFNSENKTLGFQKPGIQVAICQFEYDSYRAPEITCMNKTLEVDI